MPTPLESLIATGTKLWLDSVDPDAIRENRTLGATGATSNPIIISDLIKTGRFDNQVAALLAEGLDDAAVAWQMTDRLVRQAQEEFADVHTRTKGDDGYVSFELDPLLEDVDCPLSLDERTLKYIELGRQWCQILGIDPDAAPDIPSPDDSALPGRLAAAIISYLAAAAGITTAEWTQRHIDARHGAPATWQRRDATGDEHQAARILAARLAAARTHHVEPATRPATVPPGRLRTRAAITRLSLRHAAAMSSASVSASPTWPFATISSAFFTTIS